METVWWRRGRGAQAHAGGICVALQGGYSSDDAVDDKLVDKTAYWDEHQEDLFDDKLKDWTPIELEDYVKTLSNSGSATIAVVQRHRRNPGRQLTGGPISGFCMGADDVVSDLRMPANEFKIGARERYERALCSQVGASCENRVTR